MKTILLVDDEKLFLSSLSEGLTKLFPQVNVVTAQNGLEAIKTLDTQDVILTITDLQMPIMSGFELLDCLIHDYPSTSIVVMTAYGSPQVEDNLASCDSIMYMEKPIDFQALAEYIQAIIAPTAKGHIKGIDLPNILHLLYLERKTCTLTVYSKSRVGYLYFIDGEITDAEFGLFKAENAAYEILKWIKPDIEIESTCSKSTKNIHLPLDFILLEAAKKQDEFRRDTGSFRKINFEAVAVQEETLFQKIKTSKNSEPSLGSLNNSYALALDVLSKGLKRSEMDNLRMNQSPLTIENIDFDSSKLLTEQTKVALKGIDENYLKEPPFLSYTENKFSINSDTIPIKRKELSMSNNINQILSELMSVEGSMAMAIVDGKSGMALGTIGGGLNLEVAAAGNSEVVRSETKVMNTLGLKDKIEDILISLGTQYHLVRPLGIDASVFIYMVLNKSQANLALARYKLADCEKRLVL